MKNHLKAKADVILSGVAYTLGYDFDAIADAEEITGKSLITGLRRKDFESPSINLVRALLYALTRTHHSDITYDGIKALVTPQTIGTIWPAVLDVWVKGTFVREDSAESDPTQDQS